MTQPRWIIVSNRLPVSYDAKKNKLSQSSGGLVTAIKSIRSKAEKVWVGCAPENINKSTWNRLRDRKTEGLIPLFVDNGLYDDYYNGFCNDLLWPLFHYETERLRYSIEDWHAYEKVNKEFAKKIIEISQPGDVVWIHDFHLLLVAKYLKEARKSLKVGFFLHIPFPSSEIFRQIPHRKELLEGVLNADLIGFHDYSYLRHFRSALARILGVESNYLSVNYQGKKSDLGVFPVSIDTSRISTFSQKAEIKRRSYELNNRLFTFLGVDRLDYIKGVDLKFEAFRVFLERYPEMHGRVELVQVAVPTRTGVHEYMDLKNEVDQLVGEINGAYGTATWTPIKYIYNSLELSELLALYNSANALLITSKRDGMNLVVLEYIASQSKTSAGVVLLSEFTGALSMLAHTLPVNPWNSEHIAEQMRQAIDMPLAERQYRWSQMFSYLKNYTATHWAESFIGRLQRAEALQTVDTKEFRTNQTEIKKLARQIHRREGRVVLFLDYDGTLVPIENDPEAATLPRKRLSLLKSLRRKGLEIVVVSGRPHDFLSQQLGSTFTLASEHGALVYEPYRDKIRRRVNEKRETWVPATLKIMDDYAKRVPDSFIEKKSYSIAWHYRKSPEEYGQYQALKLQEELESVLGNKAVSVISGKKVIEVRSIEANKGAFASHWIENLNDVVWALAMGDDRTDEDLFLAVKDRGLSFKVGDGATSADYRLNSQEDVVPFLEKLNQLL